MRHNYNEYDCIFFDFDGVIVDSVDAKITAFGELYDEFGPEVRRKVEAYQQAVPGETRFEKIPRFHRDFLGIALDDEEVLAWSNRLSQIVLDEVVACPMLPGVASTLALLQRQGIPMHIVSGTPHEELQVIVERKGLRPFFNSVRGSPEKKAPIVQDILGKSGLSAQDCLFIGDAMTDYKCAIECGTDFLGCLTNGDHPFPPGTHVTDRLDSVAHIAAHSRSGDATPSTDSRAA